MPPQKFESWRVKKIKAVERSQDACVSGAVGAMERLMRVAVGQIIANYLKTGRFKAPAALDGMIDVGVAFYRDVIEHAFHHAYSAKQPTTPAPNMKRMAKLPTGLPRTVRDLGQVFHDRAYWPKILKRNDKIIDKLRAEYLKKLRDTFAELVPRVNDGEISPDDARKELMETFQTSRAHVTTIFQTETTNYFSQVQVRYYHGDPDIIGFLFDSVRDTRRTEICKTRHGLIFQCAREDHMKLLPMNTPSLHYNCRSHLIPLADTAENRRLCREPERDPTFRPLAPLLPGWKS